MSEPTWPVYTFRINLATPEVQSHLQPVGIQPVGNETASEESNLAFTRSTWLATLLPGCSINELENYTFTAYGMKAKYLKDTYVTGSPDDVLILVS